jgi:hypothetical protein
MIRVGGRCSQLFRARMSLIDNGPSPYPEVNALLQNLLDSVQTILGNRFVGACLFGSLTSGDFDQNSDIDVVVVTDEELHNDLFSALQAMHARIAADDSWWATQLEVSYIPQQALRRHDPGDSTLHAARARSNAGWTRAKP